MASAFLFYAYTHRLCLTLGCSGHFPGIVVGVKQTVRFVRQGRLKILLIKLGDILVIVGETDLRLGIEEIEGLAALIRQLFAIVDGLTKSDRSHVVL